MRALERIDKHANDVDDFCELIGKTCLTYKDVGQLVVELLEYFSDFEHDEMLMNFLQPAIQEYLNDRI